MNKPYLSIFILIMLISFDCFGQQSVSPETTRTVIKNGVGLGSVIAVVTSWERNKSVLFAILHGIFSWFYVIYFVASRQNEERR